MNDWLSWAALTGAVIVADAALVWLGYVISRHVTRVPARIDGHALESDLDSLRTAMEGIDECLSTVDAAVRRVRPPASATLGERGPGAEGNAYAIAHRLARRGASVTELVSDCGLSRGEAELVYNLNAGVRKHTAPA